MDQEQQPPFGSFHDNGRHKGMPPVPLNFNLILTHHLIDIQVYTVTVKDTTTERKTAEKLLGHMREVIDFLVNVWGVTVIAVTTDASGESRKARRLLQLALPYLVTPDCYAHQVILLFVV